MNKNVIEVIERFKQVESVLKTPKNFTRINELNPITIFKKETFKIIEDIIFYEEDGLYTNLNYVSRLITLMKGDVNNGVALMDDVYSLLQIQIESLNWLCDDSSWLFYDIADKNKSFEDIDKRTLDILSVVFMSLIINKKG